MKKIILSLYFFLAPVFVYLVWKTTWFNELGSDVIYIICSLCVLIAHRKHHWFLLFLLLFIASIGGIVIGGGIYNLNIRNTMWLPPTIMLITFSGSWLYNQYDKPKKKNPIEDIFCFQMFGGLVGWGVGFLLSFLWQPLLLWIIIAGIIIGGGIACYDYGNSNKEVIYD